MILKLLRTPLHRVTGVFIAPDLNKTFQHVGQLVLSPEEYNEVVAALRSRLTVIEETYGGEEARQPGG